MTDISRSSGSSRKKFVLFVGLIVLLFGGLSAGWYWASGKVDQQVGLITANLARQGKTLDCINRDVRGYPFRIGVFCDEVHFEDEAGGLKLSGKGFRSAAQLYRPGHFIAELDAPYEVSMPGLAPLTLDWQNLKSSSNIGTDGINRASLVGDEISVSANDFGQLDLLGTVRQLQLHARASEGDDGRNLDIALSGEDWKIDDNQANLIEPVWLSIDGQLKNGMAIFRSGQPLMDVLRERGGNADLKGLVFKTESGGSLRISGPLEVSKSGRLSGELSLDISEPQKLFNYIISVFPPAAADLDTIGRYLEAFADRSSGKFEIKDLKIQIKDGKAYIGFFQIGKLPRLF